MNAKKILSRSNAPLLISWGKFNWLLGLFTVLAVMIPTSYSMVNEMLDPFGAWFIYERPFYYYLLAGLAMLYAWSLATSLFKIKLSAGEKSYIQAGILLLVICALLVFASHALSLKIVNYLMS